MANILFKGIAKDLDRIERECEKIRKTIDIMSSDFYEQDKRTGPLFQALEEEELLLTHDYIVKTYASLPFFKMLEEVFQQMPHTITPRISSGGNRIYNIYDLGFVYRLFVDDELNDNIKKMFMLNIKSYKRLPKNLEKVLFDLVLTNPEDGRAIFKIDRDRYITIYCGVTYADGEYPYWGFDVNTRLEIENLLNDYKTKVSSLVL